MGEQGWEREFVTLFVKALRGLGDAGRAEEALRLAGKAWWVLKDENPREAEHVNGAMHYLARLPQEKPAANQLADDSATDAPGPDAPGPDAPDPARGILNA